MRHAFAKHKGGSKQSVVKVGTTVAEPFGKVSIELNMEPLHGLETRLNQGTTAARVAFLWQSGLT